KVRRCSPSGCEFSLGALGAGLAGAGPCCGICPPPTPCSCAIPACGAPPCGWLLGCPARSCAHNMWTRNTTSNAAEKPLHFFIQPPFRPEAFLLYRFFRLEDIHVRGVGSWKLLLTLALAERVHHGGNAFLPGLRPFRALDLPHIFLLMCEGELRPELPGSGVAVNNLLQRGGHLDRPLVVIEFHEHGDGI